MEVQGRLKWWERSCIAFLAALFLLFAAIAFLRSSFLSYPRGDAGIFFHAGWAAREGGEQLYKVVSASGLHFHYPPIFACLLVPFADPPPGVHDWRLMPYSVDITAWYFANLLLILAGVHLLARALEEAQTGDPLPTDSRRWWSLRMVALWVCLPAIASTLVKGQVSSILFVAIAASFAAGLRDRRLMSGIWLAAAICAKIFPVFLVIGPLWRRDRRVLAGILLGLVLGVAVLPVCVYGYSRTVSLYRELTEVLIAPTFGLGEDTSRASELHNANTTYSQSLVTALNSLMYPDRQTRPAKAALAARAMHWFLGVCLTVTTLWAFRRKSTLEPAVQAQHEALFGGTLLLVTILICPVTHLHYLMLAIPAIVALVAIERRQSVYPGPRLYFFLAVHMCTVILAQFPNWIELKDKCLPTYGLLLLWGFACETGWRLGTFQSQPLVVPAPQPMVPLMRRAA